jgi:carbamate kinase
VAALGGNAFMRKGEGLEAQWRNARRAAAVVAAIAEHAPVLVVHGNGPQVGAILEWASRSGARLPVDEAVAATQGWLGYILAQAIGDELEERGLGRSVAAIITQVVVSRSDPAWRNPSKPIGPYYTREEAERLAAETGWVMKPDPRGGWRRVVPSPRPQAVTEEDIIRRLLASTRVVVAAGGGGVPVVETGTGQLRGVEAVVDKDHAASLLARRLGAAALLILTDVEGFYRNYRRPGQRLEPCLTPEEALEAVERGEAPPGSMGPKLEAAALYAAAANGTAVIARLERGVEALMGQAGTQVHRQPPRRHGAGSRWGRGPWPRATWSGRGPRSPGPRASRR